MYQMIQMDLYITSPAAIPGFRLKLAMLFARVKETLTGSSERTRLFEYVMQRHYGLISSICLSFARTPDDFEDLRQNALLNIWRGLSGFRKDSELTTWLYRVTLNSCVTVTRREARTSAMSMSDLYAELYDNSSPEELERFRIMYELIGQLKPIDKSIVLMWLDKKKYEEIAEVVGLTRDAIASRIKRAKDQLAEMYENLQKH